MRCEFGKVEHTFGGNYTLYSRCTEHHVRADQAATAEVSPPVERRERYRIGVFAGVDLIAADDSGLRAILAAVVSAKEFVGRCLRKYAGGDESNLAGLHYTQNSIGFDMTNGREGVTRLLQLANAFCLLFEVVE